VLISAIHVKWTMTANNKLNGRLMGCKWRLFLFLFEGNHRTILHTLPADETANENGLGANDG